MTYENNLGVVLPTDEQTNKVATIADALLRVSEAVSSRMSYDFTAGDVTATLDQFQRNGLHILRNVAVARNFVLPVAKRWAYVASDLANTANATIVLGTASYVLTPGTSVFVSTDGTANGLSVYGLGAVPGVPEAPNDANAYVRKGDAWTVLSAVPEAPNDASAYMRKGLAWVPYAAPAAGVPEAPNDANGYLRHALGWVAYAAPAAGVPEAPTDGLYYGRHSSGWATVVEEAPNDTTGYVRKGKAWAASSGLSDAPNDANYYLRHANGWSVYTAPTGGGGTNLVVDDEGTQIEGTATALNFVGAGVTVTDGGGGIAIVNIPGATASSGGHATVEPMHPPTTALFNYQALATNVTIRKAANSRAYTVARTDVGGNDLVAFVGKTIPAGTTWTAESIIRVPWAIAGRYARGGIGLNDSATGKTLFFGFNCQGSGGSGVMTVMYFSGLSTYSSTPWSQTCYPPTEPLWLRIRVDGTNYYFEQSFDFGSNWITRSTLAKASYFTATHIGLVCESYNPLAGDGSDDWVKCQYWSDPDFTSTNGYDTA